MPKISIIVPVYKVEQYLDRCVESILAQTFTDFELILVDDGSPDNCPKMCDEYSSMYKNIKVIHTENKGAGAARNTGIANAVGEYILFCDSDDLYDPKQLEELLFNSCDLLQKNDLICFNFKNIWSNEIEADGRYKAKQISLNSRAERVEYTSSRTAHEDIGYSVWNKIYKKSIIEENRISFPEKNVVGNKDDWCEDMIFNIQYLLCVTDVRVLDVPAYLLRKHGPKEQQNENGLEGRIPHMMNIMNALYMKNTSCQCEEYKEKFYRILVWHLKRYIYLSVQSNGVNNTRAECLNCEYSNLLFSSIRKALKDKSYFVTRWDRVTAKDYKSLLKYILNGNEFVYKLKQYWIWKIYSKLKGIKK